MRTAEAHVPPLTGMEHLTDEELKKFHDILTTVWRKTQFETYDELQFLCWVEFHRR